MKSRSSRDCSSTTSRSRCPNFIPSTLRLPAPQGAGEPQVASLPNSVICRMKKESCSFATNLKDSEANRRILMAPQGGHHEICSTIVDDPANPLAIFLRVLPWISDPSQRPLANHYDKTTTDPRFRRSPCSGLLLRTCSHHVRQVWQRGLHLLRQVRLHYSLSVQTEALSGLRFFASLSAGPPTALLPAFIASFILRFRSLDGPCQFPNDRHAARLPIFKNRMGMDSE